MFTRTAKTSVLNKQVGLLNTWTATDHPIATLSNERRCHFSIDARPRFGYYVQPISLIKDAFWEGTSGRRSECGARGWKDTVRTRAARVSCLPALRPAREVHRCDRDGVGGYVRLAMSPLGKPGPMLSLRDESPAGENRKWNAGRRARPQAEGGASRLFRGASRTPLACGQKTMRLPAFRFLFYFVVS